jgi:RNA-binding protein PNO1
MAAQSCPSSLVPCISVLGTRPYGSLHPVQITFVPFWLVSHCQNPNLFVASPQKMAPVITQTANAQRTHQKKTRRGLGKKKQARAVSDVDMAVDEDSALTANNRVGIVSLLDPSPSSSSQPLPSTTSAQQAAAASAIDMGTQQDDGEMLLDLSPPTAPPVDENAETSAGFAPLPAAAAAQSGAKKSEIRRIPIPPHRISPLKKDWVNIFVPLTEMCGLQVRMNVHRRTVEMRVSESLLLCG